MKSRMVWIVIIVWIILIAICWAFEDRWNPPACTDYGVVYGASCVNRNR